MENELRRYVGRTVDLVYLDRQNRFTRRRVMINSVRDGMANVFCLERGAPRTLKAANVLAVMPVLHRVS